MSVVCGKGKSTWCKCQPSHDLFPPYCQLYLYLGQPSPQLSSKILKQPHKSMHRSWRGSRTNHAEVSPSTVNAEKLSPTLALLWIRVETRMVIWYVFDSGKLSTPLSDTLKQKHPFHIFSSTPEKEICRKVNLTLFHVVFSVSALPGTLLQHRVQTQTNCSCWQAALLKTSHLSSVW